MSDKQDPHYSDPATNKISAPWEKSDLDRQTGESDRPPLDEGYIYLTDDAETMVEEYTDTLETVGLETQGFSLEDSNASVEDSSRGTRTPLLVGTVSLVGLMITGGALAFAYLSNTESNNAADSSTVPIGTVETVAPTPSFNTKAPSVTDLGTKTSPAAGHIEYVPSPEESAGQISQNNQESRAQAPQPDQSPAQAEEQQSAQRENSTEEGSETSRNNNSDPLAPALPSLTDEQDTQENNTAVEPRAEITVPAVEADPTPNTDNGQAADLENEDTSP